MASQSQLRVLIADIEHQWRLIYYLHFLAYRYLEPLKTQRENRAHICRRTACSITRSLSLGSNPFPSESLFQFESSSFESLKDFDFKLYLRKTKNFFSFKVSSIPGNDGGRAKICWQGVAKVPAANSGLRILNDVPFDNCWQLCYIGWISSWSMKLNDIGSWETVP